MMESSTVAELMPVGSLRARTRSSPDSRSSKGSRRARTVRHRPSVSDCRSGRGPRRGRPRSSARTSSVAVPGARRRAAIARAGAGAAYLRHADCACHRSPTHQQHGSRASVQHGGEPGSRRRPSTAAALPTRSTTGTSARSAARTATSRDHPQADRRDSPSPRSPPPPARPAAAAASRAPPARRSPPPAAAGPAAAAPSTTPRPTASSVFGWPRPSNELTIDPRQPGRHPQRTPPTSSSEPAGRDCRDHWLGSASSAAAIALSTALALFAASLYS